MLASRLRQTGRPRCACTLTALRRSTWLILGFCFLAVASRALSDDAYVEGAGGVVRGMRGHRNIRMVSEEVRIKLPEGNVEAKFIFKNEGPATDVTIGFPEQ